MDFTISSMAREIDIYRSIYPAKTVLIGEEAFANCSLLESVNIPPSVTILYPKCFSQCTSLSSLTFEARSIRSRIEPAAFFGCTSLQSIQIPASVRILGENCFVRSLSLNNVSFERGLRFASLASICIPASVEGLPQGCFDRCESLGTVMVERSSKLSTFHCCASFANLSTIYRQSIDILRQSAFHRHFIGVHPLNRFAFLLRLSGLEVNVLEVSPFGV
jgi:hypothetical protein